MEGDSYGKVHQYGFQDRQMTGYGTLRMNQYLVTELYIKGEGYVCQMHVRGNGGVTSRG